MTAHRPPLTTVFDGHGAFLLPDGRVATVGYQHRASLKERREMYRTMTQLITDHPLRVRLKLARDLTKPNCQAAYYVVS